MSNGYKNGSLTTVVLAVLIGCSSPHGTSPGTDANGGGTSDGGVIGDASQNDSSLDACATFSSQTNTCSLVSGAPVAISTNCTFDTTSGTLTQDSDGATIPVPVAEVVGIAGPIGVIVATTFTLDAGTTLHVSGAYPFGVIATDAIEIDGILDASAGGAGARTDAACGPGAGATGLCAKNYCAGGGGGGFGSIGGSGGDAFSNGIGSARGSGGFAGSAASLPAGPLGGCPGGGGGSGAGDANVAGLGGAGGGAVYLDSASSITVTGEIDVGGAGGIAGSNYGGGGGGGAGGMIFIESPTVQTSGTLAANGGGGASAGYDVAPGTDGQPGQPTASAADGGAGSSAIAGSGGAGAAGTTGAFAGDSGMTNTEFGAGGGGGGGGGFIVIHASTQTITGVLSPPASP